MPQILLGAIRRAHSMLAEMTPGEWRRQLISTKPRNNAKCSETYGFKEEFVSFSPEHASRISILTEFLDWENENIAKVPFITLQARIRKTLTVYANNKK